MDNTNKEIIVEDDCIVVRDYEKGNVIEYRGQIPGGLACTNYADEILKARIKKNRSGK